MKTFNILALFFFISVTLAVPVPVREGKQRAVEPTTPEHSRPPSPDNAHPSTPPPDPPLSHPPLPGRSGHHTVNGLTTVYYGDDDLPGHMRHVQRNQALHPENANPMGLAHNSDRNRADALHGIVTKDGKVRDEKNPAMFHNPNHDKTTTVEYRDPHESSKEGGLLGGAKKAIEAGGKGAKGQLRANPGWLPLDPTQRRGHEAPARLNSQTFNGKEPAKKQSKPKVEKPEHKPEGYTPVTASGVELRHRKGRDPPPPQEPKTPPRKKPTGSGTNLQEGTPAKPPGHVHVFEHPEHASHFGAPAPPSNSLHRQPPRPQDQAHHERMQKDAEKAAHSHGGHPQAPHHDVIGPYSNPRTHSNLQAFNQRFGTHGRAGDGHGRAAEAPGHLSPHHTQQSSTSHNPPASHNHASTSHNLPAHHPAPAPAQGHLAHRPASPQSPTPGPKTRSKGKK